MDTEDANERAERVLAAVEALWAAYDSASDEYFDFFTADASIFPLSSGTRLEGREAYRRHFGPHFHENRRRATHCLCSEVRLLGENALVTCHQRTRAEYQSNDSRVTLLLVPEEGRLKVAHLHMSPLQAAQAGGAGGLVEEVIGLAAPGPARQEGE
jgi:ketosteroid isomerase-like protein